MNVSIALALAVVADVADVATPAQTISPAGWIFMLGSVGGVTVLVVWCFRRVLSRPG